MCDHTAIKDITLVSWGDTVNQYAAWQQVIAQLVRGRELLPRYVVGGHPKFSHKTQVPCKCQKQVILRAANLHNKHNKKPVKEKVQGQK